MVTNQSGVARGFFTEAVVDEVHRHIAELLAAGGAHIDAYYYCPHHPDGTVAEYARRCDCRKPGRGLVDRAVRELGVDPRRVVHRRRPLARRRRWRGRSARAASWCEPATARTKKQRPPDGLSGGRGREQSGRSRELDSGEQLGRLRSPVRCTDQSAAPSVHPLPGEAERKARLLSLVDGFAGRRVLVVGDLIADEFIYGEVHRVSREAPVLILKYDATRNRRRAAPATRRTTSPRSAAARRSPASSAPTPKGRRLLAGVSARRRSPAGRARQAATARR